MKAMGMLFKSERRFRAAQRLGRMAEAPLVRKDGQGGGWIGWLPGMLGGWTQVRDLQAMPAETFRDWWEKRGKNGN
jgi:L-lactate dehydrogenase complex protein LldF